MLFFKTKKNSLLNILWIKSIFISSVIAVEKENNTYLHSTQDPIDSLLPMLGGLLLILAFIFLLAFLFKRFSHLNNGSKLINIVESYAIGHKEKLAIVKVENECFLIGITASSINSIGKLNSIKIDESKSKFESRESVKEEQTGFAPLIAKFMSGKMTTEILDKNKTMSVNTVSGSTVSKNTVSENGQ